MLAAASVGQSVVAAILGLGAAGVAGGIVAMAWSVHTHQIQLARLLAGRENAGSPEDAVVTHAANGNGAAHGAGGNGTPYESDNGMPREPGDARELAGQAPRPRQGQRPGQAQRPEQPQRPEQAARPGQPQRPGSAPHGAIEGPDSVVIGELARYRVRRSSAQQVVSWAAGGGSVSQAADPAHPDDLLLVAERPGNLTVSVRLREGLTERRETKAVTAVESPEAAPAAPPVSLRLFVQDWPLATVTVLVAGFGGALVALGGLSGADFIALAAPLAALLGVIAATRRSGGTPGGGTPGRPAS